MTERLRLSHFGWHRCQWLNVITIITSGLLLLSPFLSPPREVLVLPLPQGPDLRGLL